MGQRSTLCDHEPLAHLTRRPRRRCSAEARGGMTVYDARTASGQPAAAAGCAQAEDVDHVLGLGEAVLGRDGLAPTSRRHPPRSRRSCRTCGRSGGGGARWCRRGTGSRRPRTAASRLRPRWRGRRARGTRSRGRSASRSSRSSECRLWALTKRVAGAERLPHGLPLPGVALHAPDPHRHGGGSAGVRDAPAACAADRPGRPGRSGTRSSSRTG